MSAKFYLLRQRRHERFAVNELNTNSIIHRELRETANDPNQLAKRVFLGNRTHDINSSFFPRFDMTRLFNTVGSTFLRALLVMPAAAIPVANASLTPGWTPPLTIQNVIVEDGDAILMMSGG